jgi:hypothetical protein
VVGARASAHLGWTGRHPWWELRSGDWAEYPTTVYRASGSHAGSLQQTGIDLAGDRWEGSMPLHGQLLVTYLRGGLGRVGVALRTAAYQLGQLHPHEVQLHSHPQPAGAQAQRVAFLPAPQAEVEDAASAGGQQLEGQLDQLAFQPDAQLLVPQVA